MCRSRVFAPAPITSAYQGRPRAAYSATSTAAALSAIPPNRIADPAVPRSAGLRCSSGKWPLAASPCSDAASTAAMTNISFANAMAFMPRFSRLTADARPLACRALSNASAAERQGEIGDPTEEALRRVR